ncbi:hypothetical protein [Helicobacter canis]|nr:hypothetical protein [Helicobacter canis]
MDCRADKSARNDRKTADTNTNTARNDNAFFPSLRSPLGLKQSISKKS